MSNTLHPLDDSTMLDVITGKADVSSLMWDEHTSVKFMNDFHLKNAAVKLIGMGTEEYDADDELKTRWLTALRLEWKKRQEAKKVNFRKD